MDIDPFASMKPFATLKSKLVDKPVDIPTEELPLETVPEPLATDVLFGRDKRMFNHLGNVKFRLVIQSRAKEYEHAPSRRIKSSIVYSVVQSVHGYGGRFLKKEKDKTWKVVTVTEAIQKVGHALRDKKQHDHKMKAREIDVRDRIVTPMPHLLAAKNKTVEGGCDLLLKLGEVCAKEMGVSHQGSNYPGQEESVNQRLSHQGSNYPDQESVSDRRIMMSHSLLQAAKRPLPCSRANGTGQSTKKRRMSSERHEEDSSSEDEDAAKCILALGGPPAAAKPMEVRSSNHQLPLIAPQQDVHESWPVYGGRPMGQPPGVEPNMPPPPTINPAMRLDSRLDSRSDPLYLVQQRAQQMAQQQAQRLMTNHRAEQMASHGHPSVVLLPPPPPPRNDNPVIPQQARALMQAQRMNHQMSSLMQAAAGVIPRMGGFSFANSPAVPARRESNQRNAADDREASRPVTPPPIIHTNSKDDDGHWIFYPIKVPNLKMAGKGWKLALMPIDGKGQPIELDPTNIQFPEV